MDVVILADAAHQLRGDDRGETYGIGRERAVGAFGGDDIVHQQAADLIAGDGVILVVLAADHDTDAVGIGVGGDDEVAAHLLGEVDREIEALGVFRVRAHDGREAAVEHHLLLDGDDVLHAEAVQRFRHQTPAAAVERGVDDLEIVRDTVHDLGGDGHGKHFLEEGLVGLLAEELDHVGGERLVEGHALDILEDVELAHQLCYLGCVLRGQLRAVGPVDLVAVVLLGVVARSDVDAGSSAVVFHGEGELGSRAQRIEDAGVDAVGGHNARSLAGKDLAVDAAVIADHDALAAGLLPLGLDDLGERLRRVTDDMDVHPAQTQRHLTAQTGGAEFQRREKSAFDLLLVVLNRLELLPLGGAQRGAVQPVLVLVLIAHLHSLLPSLNRSA